MMVHANPMQVLCRTSKPINSITAKWPSLRWMLSEFWFAPLSSWDVPSNKTKIVIENQSSSWLFLFTRKNGDFPIGSSNFSFHTSVLHSLVVNHLPSLGQVGSIHFSWREWGATRAAFSWKNCRLGIVGISFVGREGKFRFPWRE